MPLWGMMTPDRTPTDEENSLLLFTLNTAILLVRRAPELPLVPFVISEEKDGRRVMNSGPIFAEARSFDDRLDRVRGIVWGRPFLRYCFAMEEPFQDEQGSKSQAFYLELGVSDRAFRFIQRFQVESWHEPSSPRH